MSGYSPFASEDEDETMEAITSLDWRFEPAAFSTITVEAKAFIKLLLLRIPEKRPTASDCFEDAWFAERLVKVSGY